MIVNKTMRFVGGSQHGKRHKRSSEASRMEFPFIPPVEYVPGPYLPDCLIRGEIYEERQIVLGSTRVALMVLSSLNQQEADRAIADLIEGTPSR